MQSALVSVGQGVMKPLLSKLIKLLKDEHGKLKGVRRQIEDTRVEMSSMEAALVVLAEAEQLNPVMTAWRDDVRELSYDMEDCIDNFMARVEHKHDGSTRLEKFFGTVLKLKPRHQIASQIEVLKARAVEASERHKRYNIDCLTPESATGAIDPRLEAFFVEVDELVGVDDPKKQIIEWLKRDASSTNLQVISIVGPGGLGKTTLANAVYNTIRSEFSCAAFVSLSRKPNILNILREIAERVRMDYNSEDDQRRLVEKLREHLEEKRYIIVIDDIWNTDEWKIISCALWDNNKGSRIITTTRNSAVASYCSERNDDIYTMKPLSFNESRRLFLKRAVRPENSLPPNLTEVCGKILEKCAGLPLAIITMASLLADKTAQEEWQRVLSAVGFSLAKEAGDMTKILSLSYFDLPHPLRACLLYLSAFPEDHIINKQSLIHKWIAEGFIREVQGRSKYEVGEGYFYELINRSLIKKARGEMENGEVVACQVHDIILDFITYKAKEENFMTLFGDAEQGKKHKVRRLSVATRKNEMVTVSGDFLHVRSLIMFGYFGQNSLLDFPALRVLDLEGCWNLKIDQLANIGKLLLLKYLRLGSDSDSSTELPEEIGKLKYLETLDMRGVRIRKLPSSMAGLQRLSRLYGMLEHTCLSNGVIGQLQSLEELEDVEVFLNEPEKLLLELDLLSKLRTLSVIVDHSTLREIEGVVSFAGTLLSSYSIPHLSISCKNSLRCGYDHLLEREPWRPANPSFRCGYDHLLEVEPWRPADPAAFRKMMFHDFHIDKVPNWMVLLVNLSELDLCMYNTAPEDVAILGEIPALAFLTLRTYYGRYGRIFICGGGFRCLKYFNLEIGACGTAVEFGEGSMPKLEHLRLQFRPHKLECVNYASDFGIHHLSTLTKVHVRVPTGSSGKIVYQLIDYALGKLRSHPTLSCDFFVVDCDCDIKSTFKSIYEEQAASSHISTRSRRFPLFNQLVEEIHQDALPRLRVLGMLRSLDGLVKSLCATDTSAAADLAMAVARALSEIQREIRCADAVTKAAASHHISPILRHLLVHLAQDLVPDLESNCHKAIKEAMRILAAFPVLLKPVAACLSSPNLKVSPAAAAAFSKLSAPDVGPFLLVTPALYNRLTTSPSDWALVNVLGRSSSMRVTLECIRTLLAALPAHGPAVRLAIVKFKEFIAAAHDPNLGLLTLGILHPRYTSIVRVCRDLIPRSLGDADSSIRRDALHILMMGMLDGDNVRGIAGMLVSHAAKSDPEFANEVLGVVLAACGRNVYELVMDFNWYVSLLLDMSRSLHCAHGNEIARQLVDVGSRVQHARPELVRSATTLLIDPALLGNHHLCPVLSAAAWISGEYVEFSKDPVVLVEALLQPRTSLLPLSVRTVYIQAVLKVITFCCSLYLERLVNSNKELDAEFNRLEQTVSWGSEAANESGEEKTVDKDPFSQRSILYMINLIETTVGPLVDCNEVEVLERARKLISFVHLMKETQEVSDDDKHTQAKEFIKNMEIVFSQELSPVSVNVHSHPTSVSMTSSGRGDHWQGKHKQRERSSTQLDAVRQAPWSFETNIRQSFICAGTLSYFGDAHRFEFVFKMRRSTFDYISCLVKPVEDISSYTLLDGRVLPLEDQIALSLRLFVSGGPVESILSDVGVSRSTLGLIFWKFVEAMLKQASHHLCWPDSMKMESIKSKFELTHGMPNCCGVVGTTYITTMPSAEPNCDNEKNHNIAVQVVVDADTRITDFWVDFSGSQNQSSILQSSGLFKQCENGLWMNGSKLKLSDGSEAGEYIIGDAGYPLLPWLLTPYQEKDLLGPKVEFNRRHSAAITVTQKVLGRLKDTWKWMHGGGSLVSCPQDLLNLSVKIIHVCCLLHNIVIDMEGAQEHITNNHNMNYRHQVCQLADKNAVSMRDVLSQLLANSSLKFEGTLYFLEDEQRFEYFFRMQRRTFNYICCLMKSVEDVSSYNFIDGRAMCLEDQVAVAVRMLISGGPVETVASDLSIRDSTVSQVTCRFVEAMMMRATYHMCWPDSINMEKIKSKYQLIHRLPNCCGVIDTTYITTVRFSSAEANCEHGKNYSMAVQVVVDPDTRITGLFVEWSGIKNQSNILHSSDLFEECEKGLWLNGSRRKLSHESEVGEYIIGNEQYPLLPWLLTPYREKDLSDPKVEFNRRLYAARAITLRGLARLKDTWKCLHRELWRPENPCEFSDIIIVCCMLHNIVIDMEGKAVKEEYVPNSCDVNYSDSCDVNYSEEVFQLADGNGVRTRDILSQHFASWPSKHVGMSAQPVPLLTFSAEPVKTKHVRGKSKKETPLEDSGVRMTTRGAAAKAGYRGPQIVDIAPRPRKKSKKANV